jgi:hypothetical protein
VTQISRPAGLPKRDWILLPLISLATVVAVLGASEMLTRIVWPESGTNTCLIDTETMNHRFRPNCTVRLKMSEGPWVDYRHNECGYRSADSCGPKPPGSIRVVIIGSSVSYGHYVPYEDTFFFIASRELGRTCNRRIDVQNLGVPALAPIDVYGRIDEALALKPDAVLFLLGPLDIFKIDPGEVPDRNTAAHTSFQQEDIWSSIKSRLTPRLRQSFNTAINDLHFHPNNLVTNPLEYIPIAHSVFVAQHFIFQNRETYLQGMSGPTDDYLSQPPTSAWQRRFAKFDVILGNMADKLKAAGVPLVVIPVPSRKEAALFGERKLPRHIDPFAFSRQIETIASNHGAEYVDLTQAFSHIPNAERLFYVANAHPTADAQPVISHSLVQKLQDGSIPAFSHCALQQTAEKEY